MDSSERVPAAEREYQFGPFRFIPAQQWLLHGETPLRLGSRALEILAVLVERPGELISKRELIARAWPESVVEESNLKVHVAALRRALGEGEQGHRYVATVSGRGYRFVSPVTCNAWAAPAAGASVTWEKVLNLPAATSRTIGRDATIPALLRLLLQRRFATIVGPGGIGKTTVALAVAEAAVAQHGVDTCFVDLSSLPGPQFVAGALAAALGLSIHSGDAGPALVASLHDRRLLLVLDSCEHVIEAAAVLAERIVAGAPGVLVLATSREPLRAAGEYVQRLAPLDYPLYEPVTSAAQALEYPAVQLFAERASECLEGYRLSDADAPAVAEICRRLEGIALAIELAATRMDAFGARELAARLDDRFRLLKRGRRSAQLRHRTLGAALDWSYEFLPADEQAILRALSVFASPFSLDAAAALCTGSERDAAAIVDGVADLVAKSLLSADVSGQVVHYRLLDTTKAYALEKLDECGETAAVRRRHAELQRAIFERAAVEWEARPTADWLAEYGHGIDDVRSALAWAFTEGCDTALGIALTVAAIPLWMHLSLLDECRQCVQRALEGGACEQRPAPRDAMKLHAALGAAILYACGPLTETDVAWTRALELAETLDDSEYQLRALWGLAVYRSYTGDYRAVLALAERFRAIAGTKGDRAARISVDRLIATALHYLGDQQGARQHLDAMLGHYVAPVHRSHIARFQLDQRTAALGTLANVLWLQGYQDQAAQAAQEALQGARDADHALSLLNALAHAACPVYLYLGDYEETGRLLEELLDHLARHALTVWSALWRCLRGVLLVRRGDLEGLPLLGAALEELRHAGFRLRYSSYQGTMACALGASGQVEEGLAVIDTALAECAASEELWCFPELLRIKGELLEGSDLAAAERLYCQAQEMANTQHALSWELRAATSLARLRCKQGRAPEGRQLLSAVVAKFSEGFDAIDLRAARAVLEQAI